MAIYGLNKGKEQVRHPRHNKTIIQHSRDEDTTRYGGLDAGTHLATADHKSQHSAAQPAHVIRMTVPSLMQPSAVSPCPALEHSSLSSIAAAAAHHSSDARSDHRYLSLIHISEPTRPY